MPTGTVMHYVSGSGNDHVDLPRAEGYRQPHQQHEPKPSGLDWGALSPTCRGCSEKSSTVNTSTGLCASCAPPVKKHTEPPTEGKQGKPTARRSTPRARPTSSVPRAHGTPGRAPGAGPSTTEKKNPAAAQETRPAAAADPHEPTPPPAAAPPSRGVPAPVAAAGSPGLKLDRELARATQLLTDSYNHPSPAVQAIRGRVLGVLDALESFLDATRDRPAPPPETSSRTAGDPPARTARRSPRAGSKVVDEQAIVREYQAGDTTPVIAARHDIWPARVRRILDAHGVERRDDRAVHSGSTSKPIEEYDAAQVREAIERYTAGATLEQVGATLGCSAKQVSSILAKAAVQLRPPAHLARATTIDAETAAAIASRYAAGESSVTLATEYRLRAERCRQIIASQGVELRNRGAAAALQNAQRIAAIGVTSHDIKVWAVQEGLVPAVARGRVAHALIDAYTAAHPQTEHHQHDTAHHLDTQEETHA